MCIVERNNSRKIKRILCHPLITLMLLYWFFNFSVNTRWYFYAFFHILYTGYNHMIPKPCNAFYEEETELKSLITENLPFCCRTEHKCQWYLRVVAEGKIFIEQQHFQFWLNHAFGQHETAYNPLFFHNLTYFLWSILFSCSPHPVCRKSSL